MARIAASHALPQLDGGHLSAVIVEVAYGSESSPPYKHRCAVIVYVAEGALRTQVKGEAEAIYQAGERFYEAPSGVSAFSGTGSRRNRAVGYSFEDEFTPNRD
jgi:quercetin dioxygenase-like cupin family protein